MPCKHGFHKACIEEWINSPQCQQYGLTCPLCRKKVTHLELEDGSTINWTPDYLAEFLGWVDNIQLGSAPGEQHGSQQDPEEGEGEGEGEGERERNIAPPPLEPPSPSPLIGRRE